MNTTLTIMHFPERKKSCLVLEQGNKGMVVATIRNAECEKLLMEYFGNTGRLYGDMRNLFEKEQE